MPVAERSASIVWRGDLRGGAGELTVGSGALPALPMTFSARTESGRPGTSPEELIAAAHATCYAMSLSNTIKTEADVAPDTLDVSATCVLERIEGGLKITTIRLEAHGSVSGIDQARFDELAKLAEQRCPVSNALRAGVRIELKATLG